MDERIVTQQALEQLLREAERAHAESERGLGHRDDNWPAWYTAYIYQRLQPVRSNRDAEKQGEAR